MQRINTPDGNWHAGDPSQGIKGTVVTQPYMQAVQEELAAVPESVGMPLDPADNKQIVKAIQKMVADAGTNYQPKLGYTPVQQGTGVGQGTNAVKIGWAKDGSGLRVTVDANDLGVLAFASQLAAYASQDWVKGYAVNKAGDTMTGTLTLSSKTNWTPLVLNANGYAPRIQTDAEGKFVGIVNGSNTAVNLWVYDGGQVSTRGNLTVGGTTLGGGNNATVATDGNVYGPQWGGWLRAWLDANLAHKSGDTFAGRVNLSAAGWQADLGLHNNRAGYDSWTYLRARDTGGVEVINSVYNAVTWALDDWGTMYMRGQQTLNPDGNLYCSYRSAWMNAILDDLYNRDNGKANAGARVQWDSGVAEWGIMDIGINIAAHTIDIPAPYVMMGMRKEANNTRCYLRGVVLRNQ
ncbi:hypothetical protein KTE28_23795 [Burkholderia multivorans]|uniref:hypothetical protein n=1 Tax=Burkholderia multivorans TaxID=87883 RepID=UPI001C27E8A9|nr:hypothetical protein [Burkholderia multivorans]MBU9377357.1 hypothetical protein [Burkholderia multivorans]